MKAYKYHSTLPSYQSGPFLGGYHGADFKGGGGVYVPPNRVWFLRDLIHKQGTNSLGQKCITHASVKDDYSLFEKIVREVGVRLFVVGYYLKYCPHRGGDYSREAIYRGTAIIRGNAASSSPLLALCSWCDSN